MSCHVCGHTMQLIGVADRIHWCTCCGAIKRKLSGRPDEEAATMLPSRVKNYLIAVYGKKRVSNASETTRLFVSLLEAVAIKSDELDTTKPPFNFLAAERDSFEEPLDVK